MALTTCTTCNGSGRSAMRCPFCHGSGFRDGGYAGQVTCLDCGGSGFTRCFQCGGTGKKY